MVMLHVMYLLICCHERQHNLTQTIALLQELTKSADLYLHKLAAVLVQQG